ncbi:MAG TPA: YciI family protein [Acidimicrobiales bacterium]|nr:YciI family protein [Acidimicrobiales bacterium]
MPQYVFTYRTVNGYTPAEDTGAAWRAWFDSMGDQLVELGKPVFDRASVGNCATESTQLGGYSVISADDLDAALAIAKGCPQIHFGGGVEVGLLAEVPAPSPLAG